LNNKSRKKKEKEKEKEKKEKGNYFFLITSIDKMRDQKKEKTSL